MGAIMKHYSIYLTILILFISSVTVVMGSAGANDNDKYSMRVDLIVDTACGMCQFGMDDEKGCVLAVEMNSEYYYVEGTNIDDHGDAHAKDGFCNSIRKARVKGVIKGERFFLENIKLFELSDRKKGVFDRDK